VNNALSLIIVAGARPNFMKIAPLVHAIERRNKTLAPRKIEYFLVHTGQHYDPQMSDVFFRELGIRNPDASLDVGSGSHASQTANVMTRFEPICQARNPDWVVVVGDVNSTMACTLVAAKLGTKVAHVEAGLRSFDRTMPEEINRLVTDTLADLLLTPSEDANENLRKEGADERKIRMVGNIMIDSLIENLPHAALSRILDQHGLVEKEFAYVTLHRPSNVDNKENVTAILNEVSKVAKQVPIVFPLHPRTRKMIQQFGIDLAGIPGFKALEPIGYHDSLRLTQTARFVITDSGGLQEESTYFRTPCLTLRSNTERPITLTVGSNQLTTTIDLPRHLDELLKSPHLKGAIPPLWDGKTSERVLDCLLQAN
jgi:UDP-N-acetylglucosamine 2-epimerase (non-hydrolysing)